MRTKDKAFIYINLYLDMKNSSNINVNKELSPTA